VKYSRRTNLTDEFTEQATKEISEELDHNSKILKSCQNDEDISNKCPEIEKHLHKIKGLAPMMGQQKIGELASLNGELIKKIVEGKKINGIFETINQSNKLMKDMMQDSTLEIDDLKQIIKTKYSEFLD
jgi:chemotaxis protein histidine kinase CheA